MILETCSRESCVQLVDGLRAALAERDAEIEQCRKANYAWVAANCGTGWINELRDHAKLYLAQRRVLEQAHKALNVAVIQNGCDMIMTGEELRKCEAAITAIQEVL